MGNCFLRLELGSIGSEVQDVGEGGQLLPSRSIVAQVENVLRYLLSLREPRLHCSSDQKIVSGVTGSKDTY